MHPLHETYIGPREKERRDEFYSKADAGTLVADLDDSEVVTSRKKETGKRSQEMERVERVQRVYTTPLDQLQEAWTKTADQVRQESRTPKSEM